MSVHTAPSDVSARNEARSRAMYDEGSGWMVFAGVLLLVVGVINAIEGIAAISNSHFFVGGVHFVISDLKTWGWVVLCIGVVQLAVAAGLFYKNQLARWAGVAILGLNALGQLMIMPGYPFWSLAIIAIDIIAMYGLVIHGEAWGESA
jgi:hypothetical protein